VDVPGPEGAGVGLVEGAGEHRPHALAGLLGTLDVWQIPDVGDVRVVATPSRAAIVDRGGEAGSSELLERSRGGARHPPLVAIKQLGDVVGVKGDVVNEDDVETAVVVAVAGDMGAAAVVESHVGGGQVRVVVDHRKITP